MKFKSNKKSVLDALSLRISFFRINISLSPFLIAVAVLFFVNSMIIQFALMMLATATHELAHSLVGKGFGYDTVSIELTPLGGAARLNGFGNIRTRPEAEAAIAMAGPMISMVLFALSYIASSNLSFLFSLNQLDYLDFFATTNLLLATFNLLPALPLDGGRILRALLIEKKGSAASEKIICCVSRIVAIIMMISGILGIYFKIININLVMIGIFIFIYSMGVKPQKSRGWAEEIMHRRVEFDSNKKIDSQVITMLEDVKIGEALYSIGDKHALVTIVSKEHEVLGNITESKLVESAVELGLNAKIGEIISPVYRKKIKG